MTPVTHLRSIIMEKTFNKIIHNDALILVKVTCLNIDWCCAFRANTSLSPRVHSRLSCCETSTSREYFASYVTVYICSRSFVLFVRVRETSTSREYATSVSVALDLNWVLLVALEGGRLRLQWIVVWRHFSRLALRFLCQMMSWLRYWRLRVRHCTAPESRWMTACFFLENNCLECFKSSEVGCTT